MRLITLFLVILLALVQYPLWFGKGGVFRVQELRGQVDQVLHKNETLTERNKKLASEVEDLQKGQEAVEERARLEMRMIKKDEIFVQILDQDARLVVESPAEHAERIKREKAERAAAHVEEH